jgi:large subunit ribosomal protein L25
MIFNLDAKKRTTTKKSELNALRAQGMIPAVLYGKEVDTASIAIDKGEFQKCYKRSFNELAFYDIKFDGKKYHTILKDKLVHPVTRDILHIDFMVIQAKAQMEFDIPIKFVGESIGAKEGGFTDYVHRTVTISCRADEIPHELELDVSDLQIGDSLHVADLPKGTWQYKDNDDITLVVVHAKRVEEEVAAPEEAAPEEAAEAEAGETETEEKPE